MPYQISYMEVSYPYERYDCDDGRSSHVNVVGRDDNDYIEVEIRPQTYIRVSEFEITHFGITGLTYKPVSLILKELYVPPKTSTVSFLVDGHMVSSFRVNDIDDTVVSLDIPLYLIDQKLTIMTDATTCSLHAIFKVYDHDFTSDKQSPLSFKFFDKKAFLFDGKVYFADQSKNIPPWHDPSVSMMDDALAQFKF